MTGQGRRGRLDGWPLRRRLIAAVVAAAVLVAGLSALVVVTFVQVGDTQDRVTRTYFQATRQSAALFTAYLDEETGVRGYLLSHDEHFLDPFTSGRGSEQAATAELTRLLAHEPVLAERFAAIRREGQAWLDGYAAPVMAQVRAGAASSVTSDQLAMGKRLFDRLRQADDDFEAALLAVRESAVGDLGRGRAVLALAFSTLALLVVLALVGLGLALRRWILDPLDAVRTDVGRVADGELDHEVGTGGPPDLRELAVDVERMRSGLLRSYHQQAAATRTLQEQRELLERQTDDLRRSNDELEQFAYVASHDLQEPLRKVASFTELLQRRYAGRLDERADSYIEFAVDGAHRMQRLINDLLAFSRVGRVGVTRVPVPLGEALRRAEQNLAAALEETGGAVEVVGPVPGPGGAGSLPTVTGDPGLLTQAFQNLLSNAVKFRRPGVAPQVRVVCRPDDGGTAWRIDVEDNGIGIDPEYADRVFVIFARLNRREDYPGTGIGLALTKKIVEYHGGRIWIGAPTAPGTTISFTVPALADTAPEGAA